MIDEKNAQAIAELEAAWAATLKTLPSGPTAVTDGTVQLLFLPPL